MQVRFIEVMLVYTAAIPSIMNQRLLLNIRRLYPTTLDTAQAGIGTWRVPEWPSGADVEQEREEEEHLLALIGDNAAIRRSKSGSDMELEVFLKGSSEPPETQT